MFQEKRRSSVWYVWLLLAGIAAASWIIEKLIAAPVWVSGNVGTIMFVTLIIVVLSVAIVTLAWDALKNMAQSLR